MAEAAAVAYGVVEAVETTAQIGVGAYMVAKPTMPLKAVFTQIATSSDDETRLSLVRSGHTLSIVGSKAYLFGGETGAGKLAGNEIHVVKLEHFEENTDPDYSVKAALPSIDDGKVPVARTQHSACAMDDFVAIYGGVDQDGKTIDDGNIIWLFDTQKSSWEPLEASDQHATPQIRRSAKLFAIEKALVLYGGVDSSGTALSDIWSFDRLTKAWTRLPDAPVSTSNAAVSEGILYLVSPNDNVSSDVHSLPLQTKDEDEKPSWTTLPFPTSPLTPGPQPRIDGGLLRITTGYGRNYLAYFFGMRPESTPAPAKPSDEQDPSPPQTTESESEQKASNDPAPEEQPLFHSDTWTYQIPSSQPELKATTQIYEALKPAALKDAIRGALGFDSGKHSWGEVEIVAPVDLPSAAEGKVHPGPRACFGCDVMADGRGVVIWGGLNPKGEREGDGWMVRFE